MACHYSQKTSLENRVGLHYSRFWPFCSSALLENQLLTPLKNLPTRRIREVGLRAQAIIGGMALLWSALTFAFAGADWPESHPVQKSVTNDQRVE
jgi:hypothetical protein